MKIYLITDSKGFYGQKMYPWEGINISTIISRIEEFFPVEYISFDQVVNSNIDINNSIVVYSSSQQHEYKEYIEDVLLYLTQKGNRLIPSINIFKSHENKGYQELHKKLLGIKSLNCSYYGHHNEKRIDNINFPVVVKKLDGAGSGGVSLARSEKDIISFATSSECLLNRERLRQLKSLILTPLKKLILNRDTPKYFYGDYYDYFKRFVVQDFVPNLENDFKILILNNKYYVAKRYTRENDFRASGSGNFEHEKGYPELLDYAHKLFKKFDEPFLSLDICSDGENHYLIEFQGTHFGPLFLLTSPGYYKQENNQWVFLKEKSDLDSEVSISLAHYIKKKMDSI